MTLRAKGAFTKNEKLIIARTHQYMATMPPGSVWLGDQEIETLVPVEQKGLPSGCIEKLVEKSMDKDGKVKEDYRLPGYVKERTVTNVKAKA